ncbi:hypothetical protein M3Y97_00603100 [Aphelenchoides bicaudatus]|nr:hypothetical protein M3Y97_00603100 [Aphelenchoides bicaudatus]
MLWKLSKLLVLLVICLTVHSRHIRHKRWGASTLRPPVIVQDIPIIQFGEHVSFYANETWKHVRSEELSLGIRKDACVEGRIRIEGKRTRARLYTCEMGEGGQCLMETFKSTKGGYFCHQFYPWYYHPATYTLHVIFERRPRKFHDKESELRFRRHRFGRQATREVADFEFVRQVKCSKVCEKSSDIEFTTLKPIKSVSLITKGFGKPIDKQKFAYQKECMFY